MNSRNIIGLIIAVVIITVTGILLYSQIAPAPQNSGIQVTVPQPVEVPLSTTTQQNNLSIIRALTDFSVPQSCDQTPDLCNRHGAPPI